MIYVMPPEKVVVVHDEARHVRRMSLFGVSFDRSCKLKSTRVAHKIHTLSYVIQAEHDRHQKATKQHNNSEDQFLDALLLVRQVRLMSRLLIAAALLLCLGFVHRIIYRLFLHPLSAIPGPQFARTSRVWLLVQAIRGRTHISHLEVHRKYGPVVRVGPDAVLLASPQLGPLYYSWDKVVLPYC